MLFSLFIVSATLIGLGPATAAEGKPSVKAGGSRAFAPQVALPVTFELVKAKEITGRRIMLSDVARCLGVQKVCAESYGVDLGPAPKPGKTEYLRKDDLESMLEREWPDAELALEGPDLVKVQGAFRILGEKHVRQALEAVVATKFGEARGLRARVVGVQMIRPLKVTPGEYHLEFPDLEKVPALDADSPGSLSSLDWFMRHLSGRQSLEVVYETEGKAGGEGVRFQVSADVEVEREYPVAARNLPRGARVRSKDVTTAFRRLKRSGAALVSDPGFLRGKRLKRSIRVGEPFQRSMLETPLAIHRGQMVKLVLRRGATAVTGYVKALENGHYGETIQVMYTKTAKRITARVKSSSLVEAL